jgi:hypothetical protein
MNDKKIKKKKKLYNYLYLNSNLNSNSNSNMDINILSKKKNKSILIKYLNNDQLNLINNQRFKSKEIKSKNKSKSKSKSKIYQFINSETEFDKFENPSDIVIILKSILENNTLGNKIFEEVLNNNFSRIDDLYNMLSINDRPKLIKIVNFMISINPKVKTTINR